MLDFPVFSELTRLLNKPMKQEIQYSYHELDLYNQGPGMRIPHEIYFRDIRNDKNTGTTTIHPARDYQKLRTLNSIKLELSKKMGIPVGHVKIIVGSQIETEEQWIELCKARKDDHLHDSFWNHSYYKRCFVLQSVPKIEKIISNCQNSILNMEGYDPEKTYKSLRDFKDFLKDENNNEAAFLSLQCIEAFIDFYEYGNLGGLKALQNIYQENPEIALPFLINTGCHLAKYSSFELAGYDNFDLAFSVLFPIRKENQKAAIALADLLFREGNNYFLNQEQEVSEINKKKYQFILFLLKDLSKEDLLNPEVYPILEKTVKGLLSEEHNIFNESDLFELISIPGSLWTISDLKEMSQKIVEVCQEKGIENENIDLLKNLLKDEDTSPEYHRFLLALLKSSLSFLDIKDACSEIKLKSLRSVEDFLSVDAILPFEMLINCEKKDIQKVFIFNENNVEKTKTAYDRSKRAQYFSNEEKINLDCESELEIFAQTATQNISERSQQTLFTEYLLNSNGLNSIKNFPENSKSSNAMNVLSKKVQAILSNYLSYPSDEEKLSAIMDACLNAKNSIKGFTLFSKGMNLINNFISKTIENAKKQAAQQGDDLEDSFDEKNWIIIENN